MTFEIKRRPTYLSYSALNQWASDREEFFLKYLATNRAPRLPQENYMAVGSAFDAYVKATLHEALFGHGHDAQFEFSALFESQVESHNWDFGLRAGKHLWECYRLTESYQELLSLLQQSVVPPQFETKVDGLLDGRIPFLGKPDCRFQLNLDGTLIHIILDWKAKGYCSKYGASPSKGYRLCRDGYTAAKPSQSHGKSHKLYLAYDHHGLEINAGYMETCNAEYADQTCIYGWLLGEKIGDENVVVAVDELVAKYVEGSRPLIRVANHRSRVSKNHQMNLFTRASECWDAITSGYIFPELSREESDGRCEILESMATGLQSGGAEDDWYNEVTRPQFKR